MPDLMDEETRLAVIDAHKQVSKLDQYFRNLRNYVPDQNDSVDEDITWQSEILGAEIARHEAQEFLTRALQTRQAFLRNKHFQPRASQSYEASEEPIQPHMEEDNRLDRTRVRLAVYRAQQVFDLCSAVISPRIADEILGDAIESIHKRAERGESAWVVYIVTAASVFWLFRHAWTYNFTLRDRHSRHRAEFRPSRLT